MTTVTQKEFARILGADASYITRLKQDGRLVMVGNLVDVEKSKTLIDATRGNRDDVADRHAHARSGDMASGVDSMERVRRVKATAEARRAIAQATREELELDRLAGELIAREDVDSSMKFIGATVRGLLEVFPDQVAPLLAPISDIDECHALLVENCRNVLLGLGQAIERQQQELEMAGGGVK